MWIGGLKVELFIADANCLKHKRSVIKALKDRIAANFNVSVAEVGGQDKWQKAVLGVAAVGSDNKYVNGMLDKVLDMIRQDGKVQILDFEMEIL